MCKTKPNETHLSSSRDPRTPQWIIFTFSPSIAHIISISAPNTRAVSELLKSLAGSLQNLNNSSKELFLRLFLSTYFKLCSY